MSIANKSCFKKVVKIYKAQETNDLKQDLATIQAIYLNYDLNFDESIHKNLVVSENKGKGKEINTFDTLAFSVGSLTTLYKSLDSKDKNIKSNNDLDEEGATSVIEGLTKNVISTCFRKSKKFKKPFKA